MTVARRKTTVSKGARTQEHFWISRDGVIVSQKRKDRKTLELVVSFSVANRQERLFLNERLPSLRFSERSRLARVGTEVVLLSQPEIHGKSIYATCEAFVIDPRFPTNDCFMRLLNPGVRVGRLFYAPEGDKLTSNEIWDAVNRNRIKLPNTVSIDRFGKVYFTPHRATYSIPSRIAERELAALISGDRPRSYLDKIQMREPVENLSIPPYSGVLTSCSMYLPEHYAVLHRGDDHFGVHTGAVLLDPVKTFGTNVMLEIYNSSEQTVVNPVVSLDIYHAPKPGDAEIESLKARRQAMHRDLAVVYEKLAASPTESAKPVRPRANITLRGQSPWETNESIVLPLANKTARRQALKSKLQGFQTLSQALSNSREGADSLVMNTFPNLSEHIEILARSKNLSLKRLIFKSASRTHGFYLPESAQAQLETYHEMGLEVYWYSRPLDNLFRHTYKKNRGFFVCEETIRDFQASTILAFYGSGETLRQEDQNRIDDLVASLVRFFGHRVAILTGGGGGAMAFATEVGRRHDCLSGACFLELEAEEELLNVDFFNSFQETSRHNRQKWFEVADFCIFNIGGVGTLEEIGIELCNLKLGIRPRAPMVFYSQDHWQSLREQVEKMVESGRTPEWMLDYLLFTGSPTDVVRFYQNKLELL